MRESHALIKRMNDKFFWTLIMSRQHLIEFIQQAELKKLAFFPKKYFLERAKNHEDFCEMRFQIKKQEDQEAFKQFWRFFCF